MATQNDEICVLKVVDYLKALQSIGIRSTATFPDPELSPDVNCNQVYPNLFLGNAKVFLEFFL